MLLNCFYGKALVYASYMVGCTRAKIVSVIGPGRDEEGYLEVAKQESV